MSLANCFKVKGPFKKGFDLKGQKAGDRQLEPGRGRQGRLLPGFISDENPCHWTEVAAPQHHGCVNATGLFTLNG